MTETTATPKERLKAWMESRGVEIRSTFVPWSQSRNKGEKQRSLNWLVTVVVKGREVLTTDYTAGIAHCPSYKKHHRNTGISLWLEERIIFETEKGREARNNGEFMSMNPGPAISPDPQDVFWSLLQDASVLDSGGFEEWAGEMGYDTDSRKAEATYRDCLELALKLRNAFYRDEIDEAREIAQDY